MAAPVASGTLSHLVISRSIEFGVRSDEDTDKQRIQCPRGAAYESCRSYVALGGGWLQQTGETPRPVDAGPDYGSIT